MPEEYIKTHIQVLITNKTIFSNMLIVTFGASLGLLIKALNGNTTPAELGFIIIGLGFSVILFSTVADISEKITELLLEIKGGKKK